MIAGLGQYCNGPHGEMLPCDQADAAWAAFAPQQGSGGGGGVLLVIILIVIAFCVIGAIIKRLGGRSYGGGEVPMMTITDDATGQVVAVYPFDIPIEQVAPEHRPCVLSGWALVEQIIQAEQVPQWAERNGATGVQQGVPTFPVGSQHIATPVIHRGTGQQIGTRTYEDQGFGARHYGGSYTNDGTYYYDPDNKATVVDWRR